METDQPTDRSLHIYTSYMPKNQYTAAGRSLLHYAALGGNAEAVRILLERGLGPDLRDDAGRTPMDLAALVRKSDLGHGG